jgi:hypothetical protein
MHYQDFKLGEHELGSQCTILEDLFFPNHFALAHMAY